MSLTEYRKQYREKNADKIKGYNTTVICPICNISYKKSNVTHHNRTKKHLMKEMEINKTNIEKELELLKHNDETHIKELDAIAKKESENAKLYNEKYTDALEKYTKILEDKLKAQNCK